MLSKRFYKIFGIRVKLMVLGAGTFYEWDDEKEELINAKPYHLFSLYYGMYAGGMFFILPHLVQMYLRTHEFEIPEEGQVGKKPTDLKAYASLMIEGGEVLLVLCTSFLGHVFLGRRDIFKYLFNQLLNYNKKLTEMIERGKLTLSEDPKMVAKLSEFLMYAVMGISILLPFGVWASVLAEIEPTHQLIYEWLEVRFKARWEYTPFIIIMLMAAYGVGTTVSLMMLVIALYYVTSTITTEAFTPESIAYTGRRHRCKFVTPGFGTITDDEVIRLYRTQQILNVQLNAFFKSVLVAFHHVGCLATVVVLLVFVIRFNDVLNEHGAMGYLVLFSCISAVMLMIYYQAKMAGMVVDISEDFKFSGKKFVPGRFMFRKFTKCCTPFFIEVAYPFYTIHKETFSMFCEQVQDYTVEYLCS